MSAIPKEVTVEEFCEFLNDGVAWREDAKGVSAFYFDDFSEEYHERTFRVDGKNKYMPVEPGSMVNLEEVEADIYYQGDGDYPPDMPVTLVLFFMSWREKRDFVYISVKAPKAQEQGVRKVLACIPGLEVKP